MSVQRSIVLIGRDSADAALLEALDALPYRLRHASSVEAALAEQRHDPADLVVVEAAVLTHAGASAFGTAWREPATGGPPTLLVFASDAAALRASLAAGIRDYLLPPFEPDLVRVRVEAALERTATHGDAEEAQREELLRLERDLQIGRTIQQGFLPSSLPQPDGWELTARFHPAREVAGDFYDAFYMVNRRRVGFVIADVCDKGVGAALFMSLFRTLVRSNAQQNISLGWMGAGQGSVADDLDWLRGDTQQRRQALPSIGTGALMNAVAGTNAYITENHMEQGYFATMFMGVLDPASGALTYINGGHNPPVLHRADGTQSHLKPTGPAVGMLPGVTYTMGQARLGPGDLLFAFTDGVTDARSPSRAFFTERRLFDLVAAGHPSAEALLDDVERQVKAHIAEAPQFDDITMMALRRRAANEGVAGSGES